MGTDIRSRGWRSDFFRGAIKHSGEFGLALSSAKRAAFVPGIFHPWMWILLEIVKLLSSQYFRERYETCIVSSHDIEKIKVE